MNKCDVIRYLLEDTEKVKMRIEKEIHDGATRYWASYGKKQRIKDNMKKIRQIALEIGKEK